MSLCRVPLSIVSFVVECSGRVLISKVASDGIVSKLASFFVWNVQVEC